MPAYKPCWRAPNTSPEKRLDIFRLLAWNIQAGGGSRVTGIVESIDGHAPHVAVLSEFRNNRNGTEIRRRLGDVGLRFQVETAASASENSVLIAARHPFVGHTYSGDGLSHPHALLRCEFPAFDVIGAYLPHKKKHNLFDRLTQDLADSRPTILAGDLNTGKQYVDQKGASFWYSEALDALESLGYFDAFRHARGDVEEYSWFSHAGNGFRYDHIYVDARLLPLVSDCYFSHEEREARLSDHSVMLLDLVPTGERQSTPSLASPP